MLDEESGDFHISTWNCTDEIEKGTNITIHLNRYCDEVGFWITFILLENILTPFWPESIQYIEVHSVTFGVTHLG